MTGPDGQPFRFEIVVQDRRQERLALSFAESLKAIGIEATARLVDEVQYQRRRQSFDFDMMLGSWSASPSPGAEQRSRWSSASARQPASFNLPGAASAAIDAAIAAILAARSENNFVAATRVLDRLLLLGLLHHPAVPHRGPVDQPTRPTSGGRAEVPLFGITNVTPIELWWRKPARLMVRVSRLREKAARIFDQARHGAFILPRNREGGSAASRAGWGKALAGDPTRRCAPPSPFRGGISQRPASGKPKDVCQRQPPRGNSADRPSPHAALRSPISTSLFRICRVPSSRSSGRSKSRAKATRISGRTFADSLADPGSAGRAPSGS